MIHMLPAFTLLLALVCMLTCAGCSGISARAAGVRPEQQLTGNIVSLRYPLGFEQRLDTWTSILQRGAQLTLESGYEKFLLIRNGLKTGPDSTSYFEILVYMYTDELNVPLSLLNEERFRATEYADKAIVPLGLMPGAV